MQIHKSIKLNDNKRERKAKKERIQTLPPAFERTFTFF